MPYTSRTPISIDDSENNFHFTCLNSNELAAFITGRIESYDNYFPLFFNPCLDTDIYNSDFDPDDNLLSNSIVSIDSSN